MKYLITYDLHAPEQNYEDLIKGIKSYKTWAKIGRSCWAIKTGHTALEIRDNLEKYIDVNDKLFVCAFNEWASSNLSDEVAGWLKK